ncbi:MAG: glycosyltransferase family 4 protein [Chloroflexota bacterium]
MHILLIHQAFAALDEPGGTRHHELATHLTRHGHKVTIIASPISYLTGIADKKKIPWVTRQSGGENINILRVYTYPALHKSFVHRILSFLSFMISSFFVSLSIKNVSLVWGTSPPIFQGATAWAVARIKRVKFLFEIRDLWPVFAVAVGVLTNPILIRASEWLEKFLYHRADQLMINSPGFLHHIESKGGKNIALIPNGADASMFNPQSSGTAYRQVHGLEGKFVVLYAGAHGMSNNLSKILEAAKQLESIDEIAVVFVGDGKEKQNLIAQSQKMNLRNIHFLPPVPKTEMGEALAAANICIAILKPIEMYKTVYPNKVFDYLAAGKAIVMSIDGTAREVVEKAQAGIFADPSNPNEIAAVIEKFAKDKQKTKQMGLAGRAYLEENFDRAKLAQDLERLMQQIVQK